MTDMIGVTRMGVGVSDGAHLAADGKAGVEAERGGERWERSRSC